jgi:hypothetical protein
MIKIERSSFKFAVIEKYEYVMDKFSYGTVQIKPLLSMRCSSKTYRYSCTQAKGVHL